VGGKLVRSCNSWYILFCMGHFSNFDFGSSRLCECSAWLKSQTSMPQVAFEPATLETLV